MTLVAALCPRAPSYKNVIRHLGGGGESSKPEKCDTIMRHIGGRGGGANAQVIVTRLGAVGASFSFSSLSFSFSSPFLSLPVGNL